MDKLTPDVVAAAIFGLVVILGGVGKYLKSLKSPHPGAVIAGVGVELGNRQQTDQLIAAVNRIADVIEGKKQSAMESKLDDIMERLDRAENRRPP